MRVFLSLSAVLLLVLIAANGWSQADIADDAQGQKSDAEKQREARDVLVTLLKREQLKAQQIADASPEAAGVPANDAQKEQEVKPSSSVRSETLRANEQSIAQRPQAQLQPEALQAFSVLRSKMDEAGDMTVFVSQLENFVSEHPQHRQARLTLGRLLILANEPKAALMSLAPLLTPIAERSSPDWQPWFWAGTAYLATGDIAGARKNLDVAVAKDSAVVEIWNQLAVLEQEMGNHAAALQYISIAEQLSPQTAQLYLNRAYSLEHLGRFADALQAYQQFLISNSGREGDSLRPSILRRISDIAGMAVHSEDPLPSMSRRG